jgi:hypothetical protein
MVFGNTSIPDVDGGDGLFGPGDELRHEAFPGNPVFSRARNPMPHRLLYDSIK